MTNPVTFERRGRIGLLRIDNPPVNALSPATVAGLVQALDAFEADPSLGARLVHCDGRTFVAGGDITSFDAPDFSAAPYNSLFARIERSGRLVVAALHGTALGGGLELALACHYRVVVPGTRVGLPEVKLGLLPGSLGTQRLPRLADVALSLDMMLTGRMLDASGADLKEGRQAWAGSAGSGSRQIGCRAMADSPRRLRPVADLRSVDTRARKQSLAARGRTFALAQAVTAPERGSTSAWHRTSACKPA